MKDKETSGPAFPRPVSVDNCGYSFSAQDGMTLRDYFAAHSPLTMNDAIQLFRNDGIVEFTYGDLATKLAKMKLVYADAMLEARKS